MEPEVLLFNDDNLLMMVMNTYAITKGLINYHQDFKNKKITIENIYCIIDIL